MSWLLAFPFLLPTLAALLTFLARERARLARVLSVGSCGLLLLVSLAIFALVESEGVLAAQMGGWPAPFGITLVADRLSAVMLLVAAVVGLTVAVFALSDIDPLHEQLGFYSYFQLLLAGVCGSFVTGDLFNLYVWFEVMLIASFALLVLGGERIQLDGGIKYVAMNLVSTLLMLTAIGLLYGLTGTLNMAQLHLALSEVDNPLALDLLAVLFICAFGIKAAIFPLFFWLPASYHAPPVAVTAVFAGLLTKVGVYALIRTFTLIFPAGDGLAHDILLGAALLTMLTGVLGAAAHYEFRKILAFHIVSQIGFLILGLALHSPLALAGAVFYMVHNIVAKTNLFLISGTAQRLTGSFELAEIGGLYRASPLLAALFFIAAFSLAGFPPLSGFWAKFLLIKASLDQAAYWVAGVALITGALTLFSMSKIWAEAFWKDHPANACAGLATLSGADRLQRLLPVVLLALITVALGFAPEPFIDFSLAAAAQLLDPGAYLAAVLTPPAD
ncbi:Na+/H+ antiporter subunit D [Microbulbifer flavimaris]|uniref:Na+/H+ antiporter subunit D n=1 Tax=Microbulbifer flavimaris TaxID=1781068 RepID=A0ABX4I0N4_9GAMM|nr:MULTISPECIES: Na+/H+ antiporter subunit D [Microbulbifer]KUJ83461.1 NADH/ubiquinone/plastoquinone [Microbulbifer sp. ZGT114]PCO05618.1 Na+/H+ antiporter subunit D [Microbulbifer flavimaris]